MLLSNTDDTPRSLLSRLGVGGDVNEDNIGAIILQIDRGSGSRDYGVYLHERMHLKLECELADLGQNLERKAKILREDTRTLKHAKRRILGTACETV